MKRQCFCCGKAIGPAISRDDDGYDFSDPPSGALVFIAHGNYGTQLFDPMPRNEPLSLEILICDPCVFKNSERVMLVRSMPQPAKLAVMTWSPPELRRTDNDTGGEG